MQLAKWSAVPSAVLAAQISLAASDAFDAESALWAFIAVSLVMLIVLSDASVAHEHPGTLWTLFAIVSVGFNQIAMGLGYMIMKRSRRWQAIPASCPADPTTQPRT